MKNHNFFLIVLLLIGSLFMNCSKAVEEPLKPRLLITLKDEAGNNVSGATVRLYKNVSDSGLTKISDSTGIVIFNDLEVALYSWLAEKGCETNRNSQTTLNRALIPGVILYGYSVMSETGTLEITNNSPEPYKVSDSLFNVTVNSDSSYLVYPKIGSDSIHSEPLTTPGIGKDTLIQIKCGDTSFISLPY